MTQDPIDKNHKLFGIGMAIMIILILTGIAWSFKDLSRPITIKKETPNYQFSELHYSQYDQPFIEFKPLGVMVGDTIVQEFEVVDTIKATITAYTNDPAETDDTPNIMASMNRVYEGAMANNCLPLGTLVEYDNKVYTIEDRMNSKWGCGMFDIFMFNKEEAKKFGIKKGEIKILK